MNNTSNLFDIREKSLETLIPLIVLLAIVFYCLIVAAIFVLICTRQPYRLKQSPPQNAVPEFASFMDCSILLQCLPCTACSPRRLLKSCCPNTESLRHLVSCDCLRPHLEGPRAHGVDLVCCVVGDR